MNIINYYYRKPLHLQLSDCLGPQILVSDYLRLFNGFGNKGPGPAHGGAAENVMLMAQEIGEPENAAAYVKALRKDRKPVMGFGHRVYRAEDPRARHMREGVERLSREMGEPKWHQILEATVEAMKPYARLGVNVNVDFYAGVVYYLLGIPEDLFVPIFAMGRVPGWSAQVLEQFEHNILIRPLTVYNGPDARDYVPITARS